ncbi:helix-turn-helix domain-containing protein [Paraburkholderia sp. D1E]|uniref:helix-turn-helix domain-containing protein n=1 Tax=Paraburkholderia sp. D1E TaxID=3461398 RepID=UPI004045AAD2
MAALNITILPDGRMNSKDAATYTGYADKTLAIWRSQGIGPRFTKRGRIWYYLDDLDAWLRGGSARSTAEARQNSTTTGSTLSLTSKSASAGKASGTRPRESNRSRKRHPTKRTSATSSDANDESVDAGATTVDKELLP